MLPGRLRRLPGSYAVPRPRRPLTIWTALRAVSGTRVAALAAPADAVIIDNVAALTRERYAEVVWIRLGAGDAEPGALLFALLGAVARRDAAAAAGIGEATARCARRGDWAQACRLLAVTLGAVTAPRAVMVLEGAGHCDHGTPSTVDLLGPALLPALRNELDVLLISGTEWDARRLAPHGQVLGPRQLRLDHRAAALAARARGVDLPPESLGRLVTVTAGAAGACHAALSAAGAADDFDAAVAMAGTGAGLLARLGRSMLARESDDSRAALAGAVRLGVWHPGLGSALGLGAAGWEAPWWLDLDEGWKQLDPVWRAPLQAAGAADALAPASLTVLADHLARDGITDRALDLYLEAGNAERAADAATALAGDLAVWGCWPAVSRLGERLSGGSGGSSPRVSTAGGSGGSSPRVSTAGRLPAAGNGDADLGTVRPARRAWRSWRPARRAPGQEGPPGQHNGAAAPTRPAPAPAPRPAREPGGRQQPGPGREPQPGATVHLLGELQVVLGERPVSRWVSGRGRAVFEYLVVHRHTRVRRERLMAEFWPDASPDAARNSLNVAIHGLRQSLRTAAGEQPVVVHCDGSYLIEPGLDLWVDVEVFEELVKSARQHLASADPAAALADFHAAIGLYQGDFLADDPYEGWAEVTREHLRLAYLDCLDQLGRLRFDAGDYGGCADACRRLLACDNCREDTLRLLMRCHSRLGQPQAALRQYHSFVATLRAELHLPPAPATTALAASIRRRERV
jgi:DNA-binding SARP family transcriptional activator